MGKVSGVRFDETGVSFLGGSNQGLTRVKTMVEQVSEVLTAQNIGRPVLKERN